MVVRVSAMPYNGARGERYFTICFGTWSPNASYTAPQIMSMIPDNERQNVEYPPGWTDPPAAAVAAARLEMKRDDQRFAEEARATDAFKAKWMHGW